MLRSCLDVWLWKSASVSAQAHRQCVLDHRLYLYHFIQTQNPVMCIVARTHSRSPKEATSVSRILLPIHIMRKYNLNALLFKPSNTVNSLLSQLLVTVYAANMTFCVLPLSNASFLCHDASIVTSVTS